MTNCVVQAGLTVAGTLPNAYIVHQYFSCGTGSETTHVKVGASERVGVEASDATSACGEGESSSRAWSPVDEGVEAIEAHQAVSAGEGESKLWGRNSKVGREGGDGWGACSCNEGVGGDAGSSDLLGEEEDMGVDSWEPESVGGGEGEVVDVGGGDAVEDHGGGVATGGVVVAASGDPLKENLGEGRGGPSKCEFCWTGIYVGTARPIWWGHIDEGPQLHVGVVLSDDDHSEGHGDDAGVYADHVDVEAGASGVEVVVGDCVTEDLLGGRYKIDEGEAVGEDAGEGASPCLLEVVTTGRVVSRCGVPDLELVWVGPEIPM